MIQLVATLRVPEVDVVPIRGRDECCHAMDNGERHHTFSEAKLTDLTRAYSKDATRSPEGLT